MFRRLGRLGGAVAVVAVLPAAAAGGQPARGILEPVGGGVTVVYAVGGLAVRCSVARAGGGARVACSARDGRGRVLERGFAATIDVTRTTAFRFRADRPSPLGAWREPASTPVYGAFQRSRAGRVVRLAGGATVGFRGTAVACSARRDGGAPGIRCLVHGDQALPGPCCGPNYALLAGSYGFFLSTRRLEMLDVVDDGVTQVGPGGSVPRLPPYRVAAAWRR